MYLKKIEITGFKSFKDKTKIELTSGITAIVGPNGSGKSNVVDAIRWVLGEQNAKTLRGGKMEDVIFSGAENKKPLGLASVSLYLDNKKGGYKLPFEEIIVTRRLYRSGESEYLINGNPCRLKDITELFLDTGLGKDGYSIIGQGDIESLLNNSQRRTIFEEAAGINKYKIRRDSANANLEKEKDNITRVSDIINEIETQLPRLEEGSKKAKAYLNLRDALKLTKINIFKQEEEILLEEIETKEKNVEIIKSQIEEETQKKETQNEKYELFKRKVAELQRQEKEKQDTRITHQLEIKETQNEINLKEERIKNIEDSKWRVHTQIEKIEKALVSKNELEKETLDFDFEEKLKNKEEKMNCTRAHAKKIETQINELEKLNGEIKNAKYKLDVIDGYNNYNRAIQNIFENKDKLTGIVDTVGKLIEIPPYLQLAIEITLGGAMGQIVTKTDKDAKAAVVFLKETKSGRATFLPIDSVKPRKNNNKLPQNEKGVIGLAKDLVSYESRLENIMANLLGDVLIVDDLDTATRINKTHHFRITTLSGEVVSKIGAITGGSTNQNNARAKETAELKSKINQLETKSENITKKEPLEIFLRDKKSELSQLTAEISEAVVEITNLKKEVEFYKRIKDERLSEKNSLQDKINTLQLEEETLEDKKEILIEEIKINTKRIMRLEELIKITQEELNKIQEEGQALVKQGEHLEEENKNFNAFILRIQSNEQKLTHELEVLKEKKQTIHNDMWEEYELTYRQAQTYERLALSFSALKRREKELKEEIKNLGHINLEAVEEYQEVKARYDFLSTQKRDIEETISKLMKMIDNLTAEMELLFKENISEISVRFTQTFKEMFGGGSASLKISGDGADILNATIEIIAQPPGKKLQSLNLMSLGEKTLTAISLLFAMTSTRPSPFLLLDEIEAPLDYANNLKFAQYIKNTKTGIQFILITHKKLTIEAAENIYGITMSDGVSTPVSMKLEGE